MLCFAVLMFSLVCFCFIQAVLDCCLVRFHYAVLYFVVLLFSYCAVGSVV